jgi:hypothetical protein
MERVVVQAYRTINISTATAAESLCFHTDQVPDILQKLKKMTHTPDDVPATFSTPLESDIATDNFFALRGRCTDIFSRPKTLLKCELNVSG